MDLSRRKLADINSQITWKISLTLIGSFPIFCESFGMFAYLTGVGEKNGFAGMWVLRHRA